MRLSPVASPSTRRIADVAARRADAITGLQRTIAEIPAPTGHEGGRAAFVAAQWQAAGVAARIDAAGNVIATLAGSTPTAPVAILAHLDTVFDDVPAPRMVRQPDGRWVGPGIGDNARGLAVVAMLPALLRDAGLVLRHPLTLVGTVGEEGHGDLRGARHFLATAPIRPSAVIALDGPGDDRIVSRALGVRRYRVTVSGPGGHSWTAYGTASALSAAMTLGTKLERLASPADRVQRGAGAALTVVTLHGGSAINAIPSEATVEVDVRAMDEAVLARVELQIERAVHAVANVASRLTARLERIGRRHAGATATSHALVKSAADATQAVGLYPQQAMGSSDANAAMALGLPAIAIGAGGRGGDAHTVHEWFDPTDGARGVERVLRVIQSLAGEP